MGESAFEFLSEFINQGRYAEIAASAHEAWRRQKEGEGWQYGRRLDKRKKRHPLLMPFGALSQEEQTANHLSTYSTTNFFRTRFGGASLPELREVFERFLAGEDDALLDEVGEYVHSHFIASQIARSKTVGERPDMVVYEDLEGDVQELDLVIVRVTVRFLLSVISSQ